jgi:hypothetical protein
MVNFPFVGFSFHNFAMAVSKHIVILLQNSANNQTDILMQYLQTPSTLVAAPINPFAIVDAVVYLGVHAWCGLVSFGMFFLGGLGFVLSGVLTVIGPIIFVLWMLGGVPGQWAWNWFNALMAVGSYRALGEIMEYIMTRMWLDFIQNTLAGDTSTANWIAHGGICVGLTLFFLLGMTMVPLFAAQIFNGAGALAQAATGAVSSAINRPRTKPSSMFVAIRQRCRPAARPSPKFSSTASQSSNTTKTKKTTSKTNPKSSRDPVMYDSLHKTVPRAMGDKRATKGRRMGDKEATRRRQNGRFFSFKSDLSRRLRDGVFLCSAYGGPLCRFGHIATRVN